MATACGRFQGAVYVDLTVASHEDAADLAFASETLARATVLSDPTAHVLDDEAKLALMTNNVRIDEVYAQRPDTPALNVGDTIPVGISLLNENTGIEIANFDELAEIYPTSAEALTKDTSVLLFLGSASEYSDMDELVYQAAGYAVIDKDGELLWKGFPGGLAGSKSDLAATVASVAEDYKVAWADRGGDETNTAG